jgi:magnesium transporter
VASRRKKAKSLSAPLIYIGEQQPKPVRISIMDYDEKNLIYRDDVDVHECFPFRDKPTVTWINVDGVHRPDLVQRLGAKFGLHPLILEDIVHTHQRPKIEQYENCVFIVLKMLTYAKERQEIVAEQISIILGENFVISFQEGKEGDVFDDIRAQIRAEATRVRKMGADYLVYALIDAIVDHYFLVLDNVGELLEQVEEELVTRPEAATLQSIHRLKQSMILTRKAVIPLRDVMMALQHRDSQLMTEALQPYLRDLYDHVVRVVDQIETYREMLAGMLEIYLSSVSNRLNEVMKVLTVISTIFIPLTFIAGVYGMNFHYFPEITWRYGYVFFWGIILAIAVTMVIYFRRKHWF